MRRGQLCYLSNIKSYGQFCSIAKALEIVGERWTPLFLREMMCGSARFSEIHRGMPRMSPALLTKRLADLETAGVIRKVAQTGGYELTPAGWELKPMVETLGVLGPALGARQPQRRGSRSRPPHVGHAAPDEYRRNAPGPYLPLL